MGKKWYRRLFSRRITIALMLLLQVAFFIYLLISGSHASSIIGQLLSILSLFAAIHIVAKNDKGAYKLTWVFLILLFPIFGGIFYLLFCFQTSKVRFGRRFARISRELHPLYLLPETGYDDAMKAEKGMHIPQIRYLQDFAGFPVYGGTETNFLPLGEVMFEALTAELEKAESYIFLEYFIISEGKMWNTVLDILKRKAKKGVTVRVIYDDVGCFFRIPQRYPEELAKYGIECIAFNLFRPILTADQNNRDHRKIAVVDGRVAFTGGINLADEYINELSPYGHWKDSAVMLKGKAAWSFTVIFLEMWELCKSRGRGKAEIEDCRKYYPWSDEECSIPDDGFVLPYADSPIDRENVGEHVYLQIINSARNYVYINTPYLIIDGSMVSALSLAAKSGVDVRIVTPLRWDKRLVHMTTRSYYRELINAGVKIYEYSKGFIHSKTFVSDDNVATVGTTNLDFRSLYLHFECGVWMCESKAVTEVKNDFLETLSVCRPITEKDCHGNIITRLIQDFLRLFAPLM